MKDILDRESRRRFDDQYLRHRQKVEARPGCRVVKSWDGIRGRCPRVVGLLERQVTSSMVAPVSCGCRERQEASKVLVSIGLSVIPASRFDPRTHPHYF